MGSCLDTYGTSLLEQHENKHYSVGICSMRGERRTMEDSHCVHMSIPNHEIYSLFAIFDGFNGDHASQYLANRLLNELKKLEQLTDNESIINAINQLDQEYLKLTDINASGSTIVLALIKQHETTALTDNSDSDNKTDMLLTKYEVRIFYVGDSGAMLINNSKEYDTLTIDHHCSLENEAKRINQNEEKSCIINGKIHGRTMLSRSFGCYSMKNNDKLRADQQKHICIADFTNRVCEAGDALLLYSDGLTEKWNHMSLMRKYFHHYNQTKDDKEPMQNLVNYLCEECVDCGSTDNITLIAIKFK